MKKNNIIISPQIEDAATLFQAWTEENLGTEDHFYDFMTTPSTRRSLFLAQHSVDVSRDGDFVTQNYTI